MDKPEDKNQASIQSQKSKITPKRSCFNFRNCCLSCLGVFIALIITFLILLSLSGLVRVPLLTPLFYGNGPKPSKEVKLIPITSEELETIRNNALNTPSKEAEVSEGQASSLATQLLTKDKIDTPEKAATAKEGEYINITSFNNEAEIFIHRAKSPRDITVRVKKDGAGGVPFKIIKVKIGKLPVPAFIADRIVSPLITDTLNQSELGIKEIIFKEGKVIFVVTEVNRENNQ